MALKIVEIEGKKYAALNDDGHPIYTTDDGKEVGYNGEELSARLTQVNGESATRRRELKETKESLAKFDGIDPDKAREALTTVQNLDDKKLVDAGEVEKVKAQAVQSVEEKWQTKVDQEYAPIAKERDTLKAQLRQEKIGGRFARSKYIAEKMAVPVDMVEKTFGAHFRVRDDGSVIALYDAGGDVDSPSNQITTPESSGPADFDKAIEILVDRYPNKDQILKGSSKSGTGAPGSGAGGGGGNGKTMTRAEADALAVKDPAGMAKKMAEGYTVVDNAA